VEAAAFTNGLITIQKCKAFTSPGDDIPCIFYQEAFVNGSTFPAANAPSTGTLNSGAALRLVLPFPPASWSLEVTLVAHPKTVARDPMVDLVIANITRLNEALLAGGSSQTVSNVWASGEPYLPLNHVLVTLTGSEAAQQTALHAAYPREAVLQAEANNILMIVPNHTTGDITVLLRFPHS
jgi:hypothetical protein